MVRRVLGIYDADGTLRGELAYLVGRARGTAHCALCDITHGRFRRRPAFDAACAGLPVELELLHRNELDPALAAALRGHFPCVVAIDGAEPTMLLDRDELEACSADPAAFAERLAAALARHQATEPGP